MIGSQRFLLEDIEEAIEENIGFCTCCGEEKAMCEPDAEDYECECCGANAVYGAEQLVIMGLVD